MQITQDFCWKTSNRVNEGLRVLKVRNTMNERILRSITVKRQVKGENDEKNTNLRNIRPTTLWTY